METLIIDTGQKKGKHTQKHDFFKSLDDIEIVEKALKVGDYMLVGSRVSVDTKRDIQELAQDVFKDHERFRREVERAQTMGLDLVILTETKHVKDLDELAKWREPNDEFCRRGGRLKNRFNVKNGKKTSRNCGPRRIYGSQLAKACRTMQEKYGCEFLFCNPDRAGEFIIDLLLTAPPANLTLDDITGRARANQDVEQTINEFKEIENENGK